MLLKVDELNRRAFYEIESLKNNWSARELERQICSLLYERLALSWVYRATRSSDVHMMRSGPAEWTSISVAESW